jgi:hypothetical protein
MIKLLAILLFFPAGVFAQVRIFYNTESKPLLFGIERIRQALPQSSSALLRAAGDSGRADILVLVKESLAGVRPEGYEISQRGGRLVVTASDPTGGMYGALDVAEQIRHGLKPGQIRARRVNPHFSVRAVKFNLPWSPYRTGPAMEQHMTVCRDLAFWTAFLDRMAEERFNLLSLWNVHPFSFMVKPKNFPGANAYTDAEMREWKEFWTSLFRMCRERGIEPFIVNWNIAVSPEFARNYGVTERNDTSSVVKRYTRDALRWIPELRGCAARPE